MWEETNRSTNKPAHPSSQNARRVTGTVVRHMKKIITLLIVTVAAISHAGDVSSNLTEMTVLYHEGKFDETLGVYTRIIEQTNPPPSKAQFALFRVLLAQGKQEDGQRVMQEYVKREPTDYRPWFEWGVVRARSCGGLDAVAALRRAIELNPNHAPSYLWLAQTTVSKDEKVLALRKVLELENRDSALAKQAVEMLTKAGMDTAEQRTAPLPSPPVGPSEGAR